MIEFLNDMGIKYSLDKSNCFVYDDSIELEGDFYIQCGPSYFGLAKKTAASIHYFPTRKTPFQIIQDYFRARRGEVIVA